MFMGLAWRCLAGYFFTFFILASVSANVGEPSFAFSTGNEVVEEAEDNLEWLPATDAGRDAVRLIDGVDGAENFRAPRDIFPKLRPT